MHQQAKLSCSWPTSQEMLRVVDALEEVYAIARFQEIPEFPDYEFFRKMVIRDVDWTSTPGIPLRKVGSINQEVFGWNGFSVDEQKTRYVYQHVISRYEHLKHYPSLDPIALFIKPEPHKAKKKDQQAWRLIHSVSLVDNLISRILLGGFCDKLIQEYQKVPNKAGWTPSAGGYKWLYSTLLSRSGGRADFTMADKSQWDFTMQSWVVHAFVMLLERLTSGLEADEWQTVLVNHFSALFHGCLFSIGRNYIRQTTYGIMKSGWYGTICFNSIAQVCLHILAAHRAGVNWRKTMPHALGDDTVQPSAGLTPEYEKQLGLTGCVLKEFERRTDVVFGGHTFTAHVCVPTYGPKHAWLLLHLSDEVCAETLESYQMLYTHDKHWLAFIRLLMAKTGNYQLIRSDYFLRSWYDGYESASARRKPDKRLISLWNRAMALHSPALNPKLGSFLGTN